MSQSIDERVVEMRFDNKQFESGVKESLSTLDKLKSALNLDDSTKSFAELDKAANSVSLEGIAAGVEALQKRFSTLGIVGMRVIQNITDSLMNMASGAVGYISNSVVSGGWKRAMNIENAHFQLQALLKDEVAVQAVMDDAMASVDGTAYAYDEAAKAASQFAASGLRAGEEMQTALRGITGVAAMTNSEYEGIARIFNTVAGNGRLMGDQLLQLSSRGMNAAATIADYLREVQGFADITEAEVRAMVSDSAVSFEMFASAMDWAFGESAFRANETFTGSLANMGAALKKIGAEFFSPLIEQNSDLVLLVNTLRVRINDVKKELAFDAQKSAISGLTKVTGLQTEAFEELFNTIKENGSVSTRNLNELSSAGVDATKSLTNYINGVIDGSVRSTYAIKTALTEMTGGLQVGEKEVRKFVEEGKIDLKTFTNAMEVAYGDQTTYSKQFSDSVLNMAKSVSAYISAMDLSKPISIAFHGVESVKNVLKGLYSVLKPIGSAFLDAFSSYSIDNVVTLAEKIENLTAKMTLSERASKNLYDAFHGLFSIVKLLIEGIAGLFGIIVPIQEPIGSLVDVTLDMAGAMGRGLTSFTEWINKSPTLGKVYNSIANNMQKMMSVISGLIRRTDDFIEVIHNLPITQKIISAVTETFSNLYTKGGSFLGGLIITLKEFGQEVLNMIPGKAHDLIEAFIDKLISLKENFKGIDPSFIGDKFHIFTGKLKELLDVFKGNEGIDIFIKNMKEYFKEMGEAFTFDKLIENVEKFKSLISGFINWIRDTIPPMFEDVSFGGLAAVAGGGGIIYAMIKLSNVFEKFSNVFKPVKDLLAAFKNTLVEYQKELKAEIILKIAEALTLLSVALTLLSFTDSERLYKSALILGLFGMALVLAVGYLEKAIAGVKGVNATVYTVANTLAKSLNQLTKAVKWKAIGSAIKDMAISIGIIIAAIVILAKTYSKDGEYMEEAIGLISKIVIAMAALIGIMSLLGNKLDVGMKAFSSAAFGVLALSASLIIVLDAMNKLFKMELPTDWAKKLGILAGIFAGLAALTFVLGLASRLAGQTSGGSRDVSVGSNGVSISGQSSNNSLTAPIIALAASLYVTVLALNKLFGLELPEDWAKKLGILAGIFAGFIVTILAVGVASGLSKGSLQAAGSLLAMCAVIATIVAALMILSIFPGEKLFQGAVALGMVLIALGVTFIGIGKISDKNTWKSVLAMAIQVGVIVAALGALSMISGANLLKAAVTLGSILLVLAVVFLSVSKISENLAFMSILAMAVNVGVIAVALYALADQPWEGLLAGTLALAGVLIAIAGAFAIISKTKVDLTSIGAFLSGSIGVIMISFALSMIADQPWEGLLAGALALSVVMLAITGIFAIMSKIKPNITGIAGFAVGILGVGVIGLILAQLANLPWEGMIGAAAAISTALIGMAVAMAICTIAGAAAPAALIGIGLLDLFIADIGVVLYALGRLSDDAKGFIDRGGAVLADFGRYLGQFVGSIVGGILEGITNSLPAIGQDLSDFATNAGDFFDIVGNIDGSVLTGAKNLAETILILSAAKLIQGIANFASILLGGSISFSDFASQLKDFGSGVADFAKEVEGIDESSVTAATNCAKTLAELYSNMPKEGGWMQRFLGEQKTLGEFAEELVPFGAAMVEYSSTVAGNIDQDAVEASINAAQVLSEFNDQLPNAGGLFQKIFGEQKTLSQFAEELIPFGSAMAEYSSIVSGAIDEGAIIASANAAQVLADLGNSLTGKSGLFSHDTNLSDFAEQIKKFGKGLASYAESVAGIDAGQLNAVVTEVQKLIDIANATTSLDTSGMTGFAKALKEMGKNGIDDFISGFTDSVDRVISAIDNMMNSATAQLVIDTTSFGETAKQSGEIIVTQLQIGIQSKESLVLSTVKDLCTALLAQIEKVLPKSTFNKKGQEIVTNLGTGVTSKKSSLLSTIKTLCSAIVSQFETSLSAKTFKKIGQEMVDAVGDGAKEREALLLSIVKNLCNSIVSQFEKTLDSRTFRRIGEAIVEALANGIDSKKSVATSAATKLGNSVIEVVKQTMSSSAFFKIGENAIEGLASGIESKMDRVVKAAKEAVKEAIEAAEREAEKASSSSSGEKSTETDEEILAKNEAARAAADAINETKHSIKETSSNSAPSTIAYTLGQSIPIAIANGIVDEVSTVSNAVTTMSDEMTSELNSVISALSLAIEEDPTFEPVITPVVDMSNVDEMMEDINTMFNQLTIPSVYDKALETSSSFTQRSNSTNSEPEEDTSTTTTVYNMTQNNYSPEPLSRFDIYRQTKNLFSQLEGAVEKA